MNEQERTSLAGNLTLLMEGWTTTDLEFVIGIITSELNWRRATAHTRQAMVDAINQHLQHLDKNHNP